MNSALLGSTARPVPLGGATPQFGGVLASVRSGGGASDLTSNAENAVRIVDAALDDVNGLRASMGALQKNIIETNIDSTGIALENLIWSKSTIRDLDFAAETAEFTRTQILFQASTAVLPAANLSAQNILTLLQ